VARFCSEDNVEPLLNHPCRIPSSGFYHSYRKTWCLHVTGDFNQARDISVYGDEGFAEDWGLSPANGGGVFIGNRDTGDHGLPIDVVLHGSNEYAVATGIVGTSGHSIEDPTNGHHYYKDQNTPVKNFDTCTANAPHRIDSGPYTDDFYSKAWVMEAKIPPQATYGKKSPKSITAIYNIF
jgi:hypothetical protein